MQTQLQLKGLSRADQFRADFDAFDAANPEVWRLFVKFAKEVMRAGHKRTSSDFIVHRIRWHENVEVVGGKPFKINDHYTRYYSEKWQQEFPDDADLFERRKKPTELKKPT